MSSKYQENKRPRDQERLKRAQVGQFVKSNRVVRMRLNLVLSAFCPSLSFYLLDSRDNNNVRLTGIHVEQILSPFCILYTYFVVYSPKYQRLFKY